MVKLDGNVMAFGEKMQGTTMQGTTTQTNTQVAVTMNQGRGFTPIEEFERFAERLYNYNPYIQTKLDFDKTFDEMMKDAPVKPQALRNTAWEIIKKDYVKELIKDLEKQKRTGLPPITKVKIAKIIQKLPKDHLARVYNPELKHYQTKFVAKVVTKTGKVRYFNGKNFVRVEKVKKV